MKNQLKKIFPTFTNMSLWSKFKEKPLRNIAVFIIVLFCFTWLADMTAFWFGWGEYSEDYAYEEESYYVGCNVAGIPVLGDIYTYYSEQLINGDEITSADDFIYYIQDAEDSEDIEAIVIEIDSYGGVPVAAEEMVTALKEDTTKPTIAVIRGAGLPAAYWIASATDYIFASKLSDVGSIGVTQSYVDYSGYNQKEGDVYNSLSTGKFKDMLDPEKPLTWEERRLLERDLKIMHDVFVESVAEI